MSLDLPSDAPSPAEDQPTPDIAERELRLASMIRLRGMALLEALEQHLPGSREHADATASYTFAAAVELGFERRRAEAIREAARLHDIGKVYVPAALLARRPAELGADDHERLDARFEAGRQLALGAGIPDHVCEWILHFGEDWDGSGPGGLEGDAIPIESRVARAACACDSILAPPGAATSPHERRRHAVEELRGAAGWELDPAVVEALAAVLERVGTGPEPGTGA
jgi:HD-GYP domain-containing protein (c-di-GMP phosphodiesterase class II)